MKMKSFYTETSKDTGEVDINRSLYKIGLFTRPEIGKKPKKKEI